MQKSKLQIKRQKFQAALNFYWSLCQVASNQAGESSPIPNMKFLLFFPFVAAMFILAPSIALAVRSGSISMDKKSITAGDTVNVAWISGGTTSCEIRRKPTSVIATGTSGNVNDTPKDNPTIYQLKCAGGFSLDSETLTVNPAPPPTYPPTYPPSGSTSFTLQNPLQTNDLLGLIQKIIDGMINLAVPIAAALVVWAGILYMFAGVDPSKVKQATSALTYVVIGFGIMLIAKGVVSIVQDALGITPATCTTNCPPLSSVKDVIDFLTRISGWLFAFAMIAGVAMVIISGIAFLLARGDAAKAGRAAKILLYSTIGIAVSALAWALINIVANFLTDSPAFVTLLVPETHASTITAIHAPTIAPKGGPQTLLDVFKILQNIVGWLFSIGIVGGIGALIVAGILFMTAAGDPQRISKATRMAIYTLIGVAIIALAWSLVNVVGNYFFGTRLIGAPPCGAACS